MAITQEPAPQDLPWGTQWQQYLARQQNLSALGDAIGDGEGLEGDLTTLEGILTALVTAVGKLNTVVDLTSATSDYDLSVGETAKIDISAASTPLNIAVTDGVYELTIQFDQSTFGADRAVSLDPNNTTYAGDFDRANELFDTAIATDEIDVSGAAENNFTVGTASFIYIHAQIVIFGNHRSWDWVANGATSGSRRRMKGHSYWNSATAYTSAGTLQCGEAVTGICYFKRTA